MTSKNREPRGTDEAFLSLTELCGAGILKLLGMPAEMAESYVFRSVVLKEKRLEPDIEAIPVLETAGERVFIEFQGYPDPFIRYRLCAGIFAACAHEADRRPVIGAIFYTERRFRQKALPLEDVLQCSPGSCGFLREVVLEDLREEQLVRLDTRLILLAPFTLPRKTGGAELVNRAKQWREEIERGYTEDVVRTAFNILGLFILARFRNIRREEVLQMLGFDLKDSVAGRQVYDEGVEKGIEKGIEKGRIEKAREAVFEVLEVRFDVVPLNIVKRIRSLDEVRVLEMLHRKAVQVESIEAFQELLHKV